MNRYTTKINPILFNRLSFVLEEVASSIEVEAEFLGLLEDVRKEFSNQWLNRHEVIELRNIRILPMPDV